MKADSSATPVIIDCQGDRLLGIVHASEYVRDVGVVIVVGGPQYRAGSHRQFVLLARDLAAAGFATLRFDYRGMGDSDGVLRGFEDIDADIRAAIDCLTNRQPKISRVVLWGLCDAATAAGFYANKDSRVSGLIMLNPWVRSEQTLARSLLFHYYSSRLVNGTAWKKMLMDPAALWAAIRSIGRIFAKVFGFSRSGDGKRGGNIVELSDVPRVLPLLQRLEAALERFSGPVLLILSGADITANEFVESEHTRRRLRRRLAREDVKRMKLEGADHTFSKDVWRAQVSSWTREWLQDRDRM